jgi:hypothetical protein
MAERVTQAYGGMAQISFNEARHYYTVSVPSLNIHRIFQPSVTSVIGKLDKSGALVNWAVNSMYDRTRELVEAVPEPMDRNVVLAVVDAAKSTWREYKDETANIGSVVHRILEQELNARAGLCPHPTLPLKFDPILAPGLTAEMLEMANAAAESGFRYFGEHHIEIVQAEAVRWSAKYGYLGTGDLIARIDGELAVADYKTGKRLYPTVFLQLAAYQVAYEEEFPDQKILKRVAINVGRDGTLETKSKDNSTLKDDFGAFLGLLRVWRWDCSNTDYKPKPAPLIVGPLERETVTQ